MNKEPLYFGCLHGAGHYVFGMVDGSLISMGYGDWYRWVRQLDGLLPPRDRPQVEGEATLSYIHGYSILAFWDRSVDDRPGSNAMFLIPGVLEFEDALANALLLFPGVFDRFKFPIVQVEE